MKRLVQKCKEEKCDLWEPDEWDELGVNGCHFRTEKGYCGYYEDSCKSEKEFLKKIDKLGQLEDKQQKEERAQKKCMYHIDPVYKKVFHEQRYKRCPYCGKDLLESGDFE